MFRFNKTKQTTDEILNISDISGRKILCLLQFSSSLLCLYNLRLRLSEIINYDHKTQDLQTHNHLTISYFMHTWHTLYRVSFHGSKSPNKNTRFYFIAHNLFTIKLVISNQKAIYFLILNITQHIIPVVSSTTYRNVSC